MAGQFSLRLLVDYSENLFQRFTLRAASNFSQLALNAASGLNVADHWQHVGGELFGGRYH
jgi:hypothetical protein